MAGKSTYLQNKIMLMIFNHVSYTPPTTLYVGLYTAPPSDLGGGTEVSGGAYARVPVTSSLINWAGTQSLGSTTVSTGNGEGWTCNNAVITFPSPTANWGQVGWFGLFDAATGGNMLYWGDLFESKTIISGDSAPYFPARSIMICED